MRDLAVSETDISPAGVINGLGKSNLLNLSLQACVVADADLYSDSFQWSQIFSYLPHLALPRKLYIFGKIHQCQTIVPIRPANFLAGLMELLIKQGPARYETQ